MSEGNILSLRTALRLQLTFKIIKSHKETMDGEEVTVIDDAEVLGVSLVGDSNGRS